MLTQIFTKTQYKSYWKTLFWLILASLLFLTLTPSPESPISLANIDKLYHFIAFAGFTFVFRVAFSRVRSTILLPSCILLGVVIEIAQIYIPNRGFSLADMLANGLGALLGFWLANKLRVIRKYGVQRN